jgi:hypothetical protein
VTDTGRNNGACIVAQLPGYVIIWAVEVLLTGLEYAPHALQQNVQAIYIGEYFLRIISIWLMIITNLIIIS